MPNKFNRKTLGKGGGPKLSAGKEPDIPMKTPNWPGAHGSTQSKDRSQGSPKKGPRGPFHVQQEGL